MFLDGTLGSILQGYMYDFLHVCVITMNLVSHVHSALPRIAPCGKIPLRLRQAQE